ncbi:MAG: hypothetical protein ACJAZP_000876 [Psychromonas sp.]|jgi:uncharacterized protein (DUF302 family)|uniref:DUF302 domain-containing protein n=1 Tax=Psychromonas sp. TaxID=1884585 RepID=UPI0039E6DFE0
MIKKVMIKKISYIIFSLAFSNSVLATESMISVESHATVKQTADRFEKILEEKGLTVFARINHGENAASINLELAPTEVIIFGNPKVGTPLMQCSKTVAIDLPQKALFWEDNQGQVWLSYNNPEYLKERHNIQGCDPVINKISGVLSMLSKAATSK